jgi:ABC-type transporter Mla MlaB component
VKTLSGVNERCSENGCGDVSMAGSTAADSAGIGILHPVMRGCSRQAQAVAGQMETTRFVD